MNWDELIKGTMLTVIVIAGCLGLAVFCLIVISVLAIGGIA